MHGKKLITIFGVLILIFGAVVSLQSIIAVRFLHTQQIAGGTVVFVKQKKAPPAETATGHKIPPVGIALHADALPEQVLIDVPFTPQAPFAKWGDPVFQNACEETAVIMAMHWVNGTPLSRNDAGKEIRAVTAFEQSAYGGPHDLSADDIARLMKEYFHYDSGTVRHGITVNDIRTELAHGNAVIVPVNGQKLSNPFYTPPGAVEHTLVIIGYDAVSGEFITNDPGTRHGEKLRYTATILAGALQEYQTGNHIPIAKTTTAMVVVKKNREDHG